MFKELKFVQGAVAKKDFVPALTHFRIENGTVRGFNGNLALCSPINLGITASPKAIPFVKAIQACDEGMTLSITPNGRLSVRSGSFRAYVECSEEPFPDVGPEGELIELTKPLLAPLKVLYNFVSDDSSRPWSKGVLLKGDMGFATNNIVLVQYWLGAKFPIECIIPEAAIKEMIRINEEPSKIQVSKNNLTFHWPDGRWMRTQLINLEWPDLTPVLDVSSNPKQLPQGFWEAVKKIHSFTDEMDRVFFRPNEISTSKEETVGATIEVLGIDFEGCYCLKFLSMLDGCIDRADFSSYPKPCMFFGPNFRGAIIGMRM